MSDLRREIDGALLALEREKHASVRAEAAQHLVGLAAEHESRAAEFAELLPRLVADPQSDVRRAGVALGAAVLEEPGRESFLADRLKDPAEQVRVEATGQLADLQLTSARALLAPMLQDPSFSVRFEAARGIAAVGHSAGLEVLVAAMDHMAFRFRALGILAELGDARALPAVQKVFRRWLLPTFERTQAAGALAKLGDAEGARHLLRRALKKRGLDRPMAIELCGEVRAPNAFQELRRVLEDAKDPARGAAARGLGRLGDPGALPLLTRYLEDTTLPDELRLDAAEGLCLLGTAEARHRVEQALAEATSPELREELEESLRAYPLIESPKNEGRA